MKHFIITFIMALVVFVSFSTTADAQAKSIGDVLEAFINSSSSADTTMLKNIKVDDNNATSALTISLTYPSPYTAKEMLVFAKSVIYNTDAKYFETDDLCKIEYKTKDFTYNIIVKDNKFKIGCIGKTRNEILWLLAFMKVETLAHRLTQGISKDYDF